MTKQILNRHFSGALWSGYHSTMLQRSYVIPISFICFTIIDFTEDRLHGNHEHFEPVVQSVSILGTGCKKSERRPTARKSMQFIPPLGMIRRTNMLSGRCNGLFVNLFHTVYGSPSSIFATCKSTKGINSNLKIQHHIVTHMSKINAAYFFCKIILYFDWNMSFSNLCMRCVLLVLVHSKRPLRKPPT